MSRHARSVALFASSFSPHIGGVEEAVRHLAHEQGGHGSSPIVVTMRWPKDLPAVETIAGIPVRRHVFRLAEHHPRALAAYALDNRRTQRAVNRQLVAHGADLVHVNCVSANAWYAYRAARKLGLPLVVTLQGELTMDASRVYDRSAALPGLLRRLLFEADAITACSRHTLSEAESFTGVALGERGRVIPNGVCVAELRDAAPARRGRPYVLAIGRHVKQKGFDVLIESWAKLQATVFEPVDLIIAGDGPERGSLIAQARDRGVEEVIEFPGRCDRATTASLFAGCLAFVLPSRHEPFGIVNLEAMAAAKPVVATDVGGVAEVVEAGATGLLVPAGDSGALAAALNELVTNPRLAADLGRRGAERSVDFDWSRIAAEYDRVYDGAAAR